MLCRWWWRGRCRDFEFGLAAGTRQVFVEAQSSRLKGLLAYWLAGWLACGPSPRVWGGLALWEGKVKGTRSLLHVQKGQKSSYQIKSRAKSQRQPLKVEVEVGSCHVISHIFIGKDWVQDNHGVAQLFQCFFQRSTFRVEATRSFCCQECQDSPVYTQLRHKW